MVVLFWPLNDTLLTLCHLHPSFIRAPRASFGCNQPTPGPITLPLLIHLATAMAKWYPPSLNHFLRASMLDLHPETKPPLLLPRSAEIETAPRVSFPSSTITPAACFHKRPGDSWCKIAAALIVISRKWIGRIILILAHQAGISLKVSLLMYEIVTSSIQYLVIVG